MWVEFSYVPVQGLSDQLTGINPSNPARLEVRGLTQEKELKQAESRQSGAAARVQRNPQ